MKTLTSMALFALLIFAANVSSARGGHASGGSHASHSSRGAHSSSHALVIVPDDVFGATIARENAIFFNWSPEQNKYIASVEKRSDALHALSDPADI